MSADRDRGLGVQTHIFPPEESEGRTKVNKKDTDGVQSDDYSGERDRVGDGTGG